MSLYRKIFTRTVLLTFLVIVTMSGTYYVLFTRDIRERSHQNVAMAFQLMLDDLSAKTEAASIKFETFVAGSVVNPVYVMQMFQEQQAGSDQAEMVGSVKRRMTYLYFLTVRLREFGSLVEASEILVYGKQGDLLAAYALHAESPITLGYFSDVWPDMVVPMEPDARWYVAIRTLEDVVLQPVPNDLAIHDSAPIPLHREVHVIAENEKLRIQCRVPIVDRGNVLGMCFLNLAIPQRDVERYARLTGTDINVFAHSRLSVGTLPASNFLPSPSPSQPRVENFLAQADLSSIVFSTTTIRKSSYYQGSLLLGAPDNPVGAISVYYPRVLEQQQKRRLFLSIAGIAVVFSVVAAVEALGLSSLIGRPIIRVIQAMTAIRDGQLDADVPVKTADEIGRLAETFNTMTRRLHASFRELEDQHYLLRTLIDNSPDFIYVKDTESRFLLANAAIAHAMGMAAPSDLIGKTDFDVHAADLAAQYWADERRIFESGQPLINRAETVIHQETQALHWLLSTKVPFRDSHGKIMGLIGINRDITTLKQAEEELKQYRDHLEERVREQTSALTAINAALRQEIAERTRIEKELRKAQQAAESANQAKSEFLANMSHELRTPLNGILGYAQILQRDMRLTSEQREQIAIIYQSGEHLLTMITDILDLSKIEARKMELEPTAFPLIDCLNHLVEMLRIRAQQKGITLEAIVSPELPAGVYGDKKRLQQVLINLLGNAIKFTSEGGVVLNVTGRMKDNERGEPTVRLCFRIEDSGIGIPVEQQDLIFSAFHQVHDARFEAEGTGLGLAISRQIVGLFGGELCVESIPGVGSTFWFEIELPVIADNPSDHRIYGEMLTMRRIIGFDGPGYTILIADDKAPNRQILHDMLAPLGFGIIEAENGEEALQRALEMRPEVILIDLLMPVMDGFEATRRIRQHPELRDTIVIAISASVLSQTREKCLEAGCHAYLPKPFHLEDLLDVLQRHLNIAWRYSPAQSIPSDGSHSEPGPLVLPPIADLEALYDMLMLGDLNRLEEEARKLQQSDLTLTPFVTAVSDLAKNFQLEALRTYLEKALKARIDENVV